MQNQVTVVNAVLCTVMFLQLSVNAEELKAVQGKQLNVESSKSFFISDDKTATALSTLLEGTLNHNSALRIDFEKLRGFAKNSTDPSTRFLDIDIIGNKKKTQNQSEEEVLLRTKLRKHCEKLKSLYLNFVNSKSKNQRSKYRRSLVEIAGERAVSMVEKNLD